MMLWFLTVLSVSVMMVLTSALVSLLSFSLLSLSLFSAFSFGFSLGLDRSLVMVTDLLHLAARSWSRIGVTDHRVDSTLQCATLVFYPLLTTAVLVTRVGTLGTVCRLGFCV